jgi:hypothetical protein
MAGRDGRMLFCAMSGIQRHAAAPVATVTNFAEAPQLRQHDIHHAPERRQEPTDPPIGAN